MERIMMQAGYTGGAFIRQTQRERERERKYGVERERDRESESERHKQCRPNIHPLADEIKSRTGRLCTFDVRNFNQRKTNIYK